MNQSVIFARPEFDLLQLTKSAIIEKLQNSLRNRVSAAYIFGSFAKGDIGPMSDIDLILVKETSTPFIERSREFIDLGSIFCDIDILVYTPDELKRQLADSQFGFRKSMRESMQKIL